MKNLEIILLDDDLIFLMLQRRILLGAGIKNVIKSFSDADEAFSYIEDASSDTIFLLFLDINLAQTNARVFLNNLVSKDLDSKIFTVIATSSVNTKDMQLLHDFKCVIDFIEKPLTKEMIQKIKSNPLVEKYIEM